MPAGASGPSRPHGAAREVGGDMGLGGPARGPARTSRGAASRLAAGKWKLLNFGPAGAGLLRPRRASTRRRRRSGGRRSGLGLWTVQGGRGGAVLRQGGGPFQPSCAARLLRECPRARARETDLGEMRPRSGPRPGGDEAEIGPARSGRDESEVQGDRAEIRPRSDRRDQGRCRGGAGRWHLLRGARALERRVELLQRAWGRSSGGGQGSSGEVRGRSWADQRRSAEVGARSGRGRARSGRDQGETQGEIRARSPWWRARACRGCPRTAPCG